MKAWTKKLLALTLALVMLLGVLAGCDTDKPVETQPKETKPAETKPVETQPKETESDEIALDEFKGTKLKGLIVKYSRDESNGPDDKAVLQEAEEALGIDIEWTIVEDSVYKDQRSIILASGDLPDFMLGMMDNNTLVENADMFMNLLEDDMLQTYAPNVLRDYELGKQNVLEALTLADGSVRCLAGNIGTEFNSNIFNVMWINKVWLDKIGKDVPKTTDELYEVLKAFRDGDMDGDGDTTDEIPMAFCAANNYNIINMANSFGIAGTGYGNDTYYWEMHDGKVEPTADTDEYRMYLEYCHKLAAEGLLSLEGYTDTYEQYTAKLAEGRIGVWFGWAPSTDSCGNPEEFVPMLAPQGIAGVDPVKTGYLDKEVYRQAALVISAECENPEAVLHWWNYLSRDVETKYRCRWGNFYYDEDGIIRNNLDPALRPEGVSASTLEYTYGMGNQTSPYIGPHEYMQKFDETNLRHLFYDEVKDIIPAGVNVEVISSKAMVDPDNVSERTFLETDLIPMMDNFAATAIADGVTDDSWNQYLKDLETYGYYDWVQWYQDFADGVF